MRITVDRVSCEGHGLCEEVAPEIFELDDDGNLLHHFEGEVIPPELEVKAKRAIGVCPVAALSRGG